MKIESTTRVTLTLQEALELAIERLSYTGEISGETRVLWPDLDVPDLKITIIAEATDE